MARAVARHIVLIAAEQRRRISSCTTPIRRIHCRIDLLDVFVERCEAHSVAFNKLACWTCVLSAIIGSSSYPNDVCKHARVHIMQRLCVVAWIIGNKAQAFQRREELLEFHLILRLASISFISAFLAIIVIIVLLVAALLEHIC